MTGPDVRSLPNAEHDPLCPPPWKWGEGGHCEGCDLIATVRADERSKVAQRITERAWQHSSDAETLKAAGVDDWAVNASVADELRDLAAQVRTA